MFLIIARLEMKFMKRIEKLPALIFFSSSALLCSILIQFTNCNDGNGKINTNESDVNARIDAAISCTANGLTVADSTLYMQGGGREFRKTLVNQQARPNAVPAGMVWIPGGEFSMGGVNPVGITEGGGESMNDARPVHRVHERIRYHSSIKDIEFIPNSGWVKTLFA